MPQHTLTRYKVNSLDDSINLMRQAVVLGLNDPSTRELAACTIRGCDDRDDRCEVYAVFEFIKQHVKYVADPRLFDTFATLERTLTMGIGDCDDQSVATCTLLEALGFQTSFRVIQTKGSPTWNHVYALVHLPKRRPTGTFPLDHTLANPKPGIQPPVELIVKYKDFPVLTERMIDGP